MRILPGGAAAFVLFLAGCVTAPVTVAEDGSVRGVSPAAMAALPRGISPAFLIKDVNNCYGIAVEASDPPRAVPLLNDAGQQVCDA
jgi:hypothetical protein